MEFFFNYIITIAIDDPTWAKQAKNAALLVIQSILFHFRTQIRLVGKTPSHSANYQGKGASPSAKFAWYRESSPF